MTPHEALRDIRGYAAANRVRIEVHALRRMRQRCVTPADLVHALCHAYSVQLQPNDRWRSVGPDLEGEELTVLLVLEQGVIVVTVF